MQKVETKPGTVHQVVSGDTIVVAGPIIQSDDDIQGLRAVKTIRLIGIAAPDPSQFHSFFLSREFLRKWLISVINGQKNGPRDGPLILQAGALDSSVSITFRERFVDEQKRHHCDCYVKGVDLSLLMIQNGWAKILQESADSKRTKEDNEYYSRLRKAQQIATREKKGIWGLQGAVPPMVRVNCLPSLRSGAVSNQRGTTKDQKRLVWGVIEELLQDGTLKITVPPTDSDFRYLSVSSVRSAAGLDIPSNRTVRFLLSELLLNRDVQVAGDNKTAPQIIIQSQPELAKILIQRGLLRLKPIIVQVRAGTKKPELPARLDEYLESKFGPVGHVDRSSTSRAMVFFLSESDADNCLKVLNPKAKPLEYPLEALPFIVTSPAQAGAIKGQPAQQQSQSKLSPRQQISSQQKQQVAREAAPVQAQRGPSDPRVKQLCTMGFSEQIARKALIQSKWDVNLALDALLSGECQESSIQDNTTEPSLMEGQSHISGNADDATVRESSSHQQHVRSEVPTESIKEQGHLVRRGNEEDEVIDQPPKVHDAATVETEANDDDTTVSSPEGSVSKNGEVTHRPPPDIEMETEYLQPMKENVERMQESAERNSKSMEMTAVRTSILHNDNVNNTVQQQGTDEEFRTQGSVHNIAGEEFGRERGVRVKISTDFFPEADDPRYLRISEGDEVDLLIANQSESGWAYGRIGDTAGWFPHICLGDLDLVVAKYEFIEQPEDSRPYLKLHLDTVCIVEHRYECGWWLGSTLSKPDGRVGVKGYFPANFVQSVSAVR